MGNFKKKIRKTFVQKLHNNDVPLTQIMTNTSHDDSESVFNDISQHCPKVTTRKSVACATHLVKQ